MLHLLRINGFLTKVCDKANEDISFLRYLLHWVAMFPQHTSTHLAVFNCLERSPLIVDLNPDEILEIYTHRPSFHLKPRWVFKPETVRLLAVSLGEDRLRSIAPNLGAAGADFLRNSSDFSMLYNGFSDEELNVEFTKAVFVKAKTLNITPADLSLLWVTSDNVDEVLDYVLAQPNVVKAARWLRQQKIAMLLGHGSSDRVTQFLKRLVQDEQNHGQGDTHFLKNIAMTGCLYGLVMRPNVIDDVFTKLQSIVGEFKLNSSRVEAFCTDLVQVENVEDLVAVKFKFLASNLDSRNMAAEFLVYRGCSISHFAELLCNQKQTDVKMVLRVLFAFASLFSQTEFVDLLQRVLNAYPTARTVTFVRGETHLLTHVMDVVNVLPNVFETDLLAGLVLNITSSEYTVDELALMVPLTLLVSDKIDHKLLEAMLVALTQLQQDMFTSFGSAAVELIDKLAPQFTGNLGQLEAMVRVSLTT